MKKFTFGLIIVTTVLFLGIIFFQKPLLANTENDIQGNGEESNELLLNITTVSKNQYEMVKSIVLDKHNVEYLSENESEIYDFKYNEDIINHMSERDLFIYSGLNNEPWINEFIGTLKKGDLGIINMSRGIKTLTYEDDGSKENPYYWLGIYEYRIALYNVKCAIQEKDPKNKSYYEENYVSVINEIDNYMKDVRTELEKYKGHTILTNTNTFDYLLRDLGLEVVNVEGEVTRKLLEEKSLDENKIIFVKEKNPIERKDNIETKYIIEFEKQEEDKETLNNEVIEVEKPLEIKEVDLVRWDSERTLVELAVSNINLIIDTLKKLPALDK